MWDDESNDHFFLFVNKSMFSIGVDGLWLDATEPEFFPHFNMTLRQRDGRCREKKTKNIRGDEEGRRCVPRNVSGNTVFNSFSLKVSLCFERKRERGAVEESEKILEVVEREGKQARESGGYQEVWRSFPVLFFFLFFLI